MQKSLSPKLGLTLERLFWIAIAIGLLLRLLNLGTREFWYDEVLSLLLSTGQKLRYTTPGDVPVSLGQYAEWLNLPVEPFSKTLQGLMRGLYAGEPHPPLFFLTQHFWLRLFGNREIAVRSLPMLWSVGAIAAAYGFGRKLINHRSGLLLAALLATNPFYLFHSLNMRMYTPLVLWVLLSAWAVLELNSDSKRKGIWHIILIGSIFAGLMTFYLLAYWVVGLALLIILLRMWKAGLSLGAGIALTLPWAIWGTLKQLRNADLDRFSATKQAGNAALIHLQNVLQTFGIHLLVGDWTTRLPSFVPQLAGLGAVMILGAIVFYLWRFGERRRLTVACIMGIFPLLLALGVDVLTGKFTLGFGWGRALIVILPGCLLMLVLGIELLGRWRSLVATSLLMLYLAIDVSDFTVRQRTVFHQIADLIRQDPSAPTLIALDSQAWGHVNRFAYYLPKNASVSLLAQPSVKLGTALETTMAQSSSQYQRVLWLESAAPIWSLPATEADRQRIDRVLSKRFRLTQTQTLTGTMDLDDFQLRLYTPLSNLQANP